MNHPAFERLENRCVLSGVAPFAVGAFFPPTDPIPVGFGPTDVSLANLNPGGLPVPGVAAGPLGKSEMPSLVVLLSASSMANLLAEMENISSPMPTESDAPLIDAYIPDDAGTVPPSRLDRFVVNLGVSSVDFSRESGDRPGRVPEFGPEWVWHRPTRDPFATTAKFDDGPKDSLSAPHADRAANIAIGGLVPIVSAGGQARFPSERETSFLARPAVILASVVALAIGVIVLGRRTLGNLPNWRGKPARREPIEERKRVGASRSGSKSRSSNDLPPWLQGPMSVRHRRTVSARSLASTLFRKRDRGN